MIRLCAFADEISPDLDEQIAVLLEEGVHAVELRSVGGINVLDLDDAQIATALDRFREAGIQVACIGSPIGKVHIADAAGENDRMERAIAVAQQSGARMIRVFSFYPDGGSGDARFRSRVLEAMTPLVGAAAGAGITLVHENEKEIYGDTVPRCRVLLERFGGDGLRAAFDPANFIQCGETPYPDAYSALRPWIDHVHVKDALPDGTVVPVGEGAGRWPELLTQLRDSGYNGFLSLEPHLTGAGQFGGYSGPERFRQAARALTSLLDAMHWPYG